MNVEGHHPIGRGNRKWGCGVASYTREEVSMLKGGVLWLLGIPLPVIIVLWLMGYLS